MDAVSGIVIAGVLGLITLIFGLKYLMNSPETDSKQESAGADSDTPRPSATASDDVTATNGRNQTGGDGRGNKHSKQKAGRHKSVSDSFTHPLLVTSLKGHGGEVTDFDLSANGKYLISTAEDRSLFLWTIKDLTTAGKGLKSVRANVEYDSARLIKFSPDNKSFITSLENGNTIRVYKLGRTDDGSLGKVQQALDDFPKLHEDEIMNVGIDSAGNYLMTATYATRFDILSLRGDRLCSVDTGTMKNCEAAVSPCGRFVAVCGFTPDVKVWEILFDKTKQFKSAKRVFDLTGHKAGVLSIAFSADSSRIATVAKDSTWKLWKADVEYGRGQDPVLVCTGKIEDKADTTRIAVTPDGRTVAIAIGNNITIYNGFTQEKDVELKAIFSSGVRRLMFSIDGKYLLCCGDRQVKVFNNITGYRSKILDFTSQLQSCNKNMERRLTEQLEEARAALRTLEEMK